MANRVSASIRLGGSLPPAIYDELAQIILTEGLAVEWDGEPFDPSDPSHRTPGKPLDLYAHEVSGGCFEELEDRCIALKLPYLRSCDGYPGEWSPERVVFTGEGEPVSYPADEAGHVVMNRGTAERLGSLEAIVAWFDAADFRVPPLIIEGDPVDGPLPEGKL
ncbi:hypothetical protein CA262_08130 [Sphingobium sp. GW456-12-10-14-TSB1]|uniref:hypothetical protein n=1 Tax=Sphingobium sp. GW456-12-10-14-TSB1 TaxID=1987165 RepID=UPI000A383BCC|nr:hypothetical protein [Sphingobium sp. GW456-12-10-14-TSB1]OUC56757.1 hypothetical protein CA262_08130 [Sphingobium sp. GW456-12-10-14-TSB1]